MPRPPYPPEFRLRLIELARSGRPISQLAHEFEPSAQTIYSWLKQAERDEDEVSSAEHVELKRLRAENRRLQQERDILAKAAAWFARETGSIPSGSSSS